jgi:hypothetical protein
MLVLAFNYYTLGSTVAYFCSKKKKQNDKVGFAHVEIDIIETKNTSLQGMKQEA